MSIKDLIIKNLKQGTLLKNGFNYFSRRIEKKIKYNNLNISSDKSRVEVKKIYDSLNKIDTNFVEIGNYYSHKNKSMNSESIIYSLGVGNHIDFDVALATNYKCPVYMFDPTPLSIEFMKKQNIELLIFSPVGVWTEETTLTFFTPKNGGSSSALNQFENSSNSFQAKCKTLDTLMKGNNHQQIDYLKMDIEGAALPILIHTFENGIFPSQIMTEFESPADRDYDKQKEYIEDIQKVLSLAKSNDYSIYALPYSGAKYYALELLMVKNTNLS